MEDLPHSFFFCFCFVLLCLLFLQVCTNSQTGTCKQVHDWTFSKLIELSINLIPYKEIKVEHVMKEKGDIEITLGFICTTEGMQHFDVAKAMFTV